MKGDKMKVFRMDDYSWYAAETEYDAIQAWENDSGEGYTEFLEDGYPKECNIETDGMWIEIEPSRS